MRTVSHLTCLMLIATARTIAAEPGDDLLHKFRREFVLLAPGEPPYPPSFKMGGDAPPSTQPRHSVTFRYAFSISKYETTQELYQHVIGTNPSRWTGPRNSVERVAFADACRFCELATKRLRASGIINDDQIIRLPTEAEWEYATRAATRGSYSFGDDADQLGDFAWFHGNAAGNDPPVGAKRPNPWGLYDVHGYLWEWTADHWHDTFAGAPTDGTPWYSTTNGESTARVVRGGSWKDPADKLTSAYRRAVSPETKDDAIGFRCVLATERPE